MSEVVSLVAEKWFTITGRGRLALVNLRQLDSCPERIGTDRDIPVQIGDHVRIDGDEYEVRGMELTRALIHPPFIKPDVGLLVRKVDPPT